jgi:hypothetical protein
MKYEITWLHPSEDKPTILENVRITKQVIESLEAEHNDQIIAVKPIH